MRAQNSTLSNQTSIPDPLPRAGDLADYDVVQLLWALHTRRTTGVLQLAPPKAGLRTLYYLEGEVVAASSSEEELRVGRLLYRSGHISQAQLLDALACVQPEKVLGEVLVEKGYISAELRQEALSAQFKEILYSTFLLRQGPFQFSPEDAIFAPNLQLFFDTEHLFREGLRLTEQVSDLNRALEELDHVYGRTNVLSALPLRVQEEELLRLIDGRRTTTELIVLSPMEHLPTLAALVQLLERGLVCKVKEVPKRTSDEPDTYPLLPEELRPPGGESTSPDAPIPPNPAAQDGVFLSAQSVLDIVDLSHVRQYGIATDIPLDGIVEAAGAEDDDHHSLTGDHTPYTFSHDHEAEGLDQGEDEDEDDSNPAESAIRVAVLEEALAGGHDEELTGDLEDTSDGEDDLDTGHFPVEDFASDDDFPSEEDDGLGHDPLDEDHLEHLSEQDLLDMENMPEPDDELVELRPEDVASMQTDGESLSLEETLFTPPAQAEESVSMLDEAPTPAEEDSQEIDPAALVTGASIEAPDEDTEEHPQLEILENVEAEEEEDEVPLLQSQEKIPPMPRKADLGLPGDADVSDAELLVLATIRATFKPRPPEAPSAASGDRRRRRGSLDQPRGTTSSQLTHAQRQLLRQRIELYNQMYFAIFSACVRSAGVDRTRQLFTGFFAPGNSSYPELFIDLSFRPDGALDVELMLRNLEAYPTARPATALDASLGEIFSYLVREAQRLLPEEDQQGLLEDVHQLRNQLYKKAALPA